MLFYLSVCINPEKRVVMYLCVRVSILPLSTIFPLTFGTVPKAWFFLLFFIVIQLIINCIHSWYFSRGSQKSLFRLSFISIYFCLQSKGDQRILFYLVGVFFLLEDTLMNSIMSLAFRWPNMVLIFFLSLFCPLITPCYLPSI